MITSTKNDQVKNISLLQKKASKRKADWLFVIEGMRAVSEVPLKQLKSVYITSELLNTESGASFVARIRKEAPEVVVEEVSEAVYNAMSDTVSPQGILAVVSMCNYTLSDVLGEKEGQVPHVIILESLQDPGNLGTIVRTALGAGATGIIMNQTTVDIYSPKVVRSTMGALFKMPHLVVEDLHATMEELKAKGVSLYAAHLKGEKFYDKFDSNQPCGFLIGNEGNGLTKETADLASDYLKIPMEGGLESLNASVAAAILMYEVHRQR